MSHLLEMRESVASYLVAAASQKDGWMVCETAVRIRSQPGSKDAMEIFLSASQKTGQT